MTLSIKKVILFNSLWGRREGTEREKLIYSSSTPSLSDLTINPVKNDDYKRLSTNSDHFESSNESILEEERDDLKQVSLCEASINFLESISGQSDDLPISIEGYSGTMLIFRRVEKPGFWFVAVLIPSSSSEFDSQQLPNYCHEYYVTYKLLGTSYSSFVRSNGTLKHVSNSGCGTIGIATGISSKVRMRKVCQLFFEWNLPHLMAESGLVVPLPKPSPLNVFGGKFESLMKYMALDSRSFVAIQSFVNHITFSINVIPQMDTVFIYNDLLVTSSLDLSSTRILYSFVTASIIPEIMVEELNRQKKRPADNCYWCQDGKPQIIYLPNSILSLKSSLSGQDLDSNRYSDRDVNQDEDQNQDCKEDKKMNQEWSKKDLYIYRSVNGSTLLIVLKSLDIINADENAEIRRKSLLTNIDLYSKQHLYQLTAQISQMSLHSSKSSSLSLSSRLLSSSCPDFCEYQVDSSISYLYYNEANGALQMSNNQNPSSSSGLRKQVSSSNFGTPIHRNHSSNTSLQLQVTSVNNDPLATWATFESDLRTTLMTAEEDEKKSRLQSNQDKNLCPNPASDLCPPSKLEGSLEVIAKTDSDDHWIIFKRADKRCFFATLTNHKNMNLPQIATLCNSKWSNVTNPRKSDSTSSSAANPSTNISCLPFAQLVQ